MMCVCMKYMIGNIGHTHQAENVQGEITTGVIEWSEEPMKNIFTLPAHRGGGHFIREVIGVTGM